jgi:hypothetical protein
MRRCSFLKTSLWLLLVCGVVSADQAADDAAVKRVIAGLNEIPQRAGLFTADSDARAVIAELSRGRRVRYQLRSVPVDVTAGRPSVTISHEPWGEATLNFPGIGLTPTLEILNPRIEANAVHFTGDDAALADAAWTYREDGSTQTTPLLFVLRREGLVWKIAAVVRAPAAAK